MKKITKITPNTSPVLFKKNSFSRSTLASHSLTTNTVFNTQKYRFVVSQQKMEKRWFGKTFPVTILKPALSKNLQTFGARYYMQSKTYKGDSHLLLNWTNFSINKL